TKWHMVDKCAKTLGIKPSEIISIGNDTNDITMLTHSGIGVAVANSTEDVKKTASLVSPYTNNQAGVAKALKELFNL
ncbi:MAG TPA: HAD hydrolase family protein, partial [Clostridia bacterium]|nr:HAD hydrolase family protein [Clostridia bacterium]